MEVKFLITGDLMFGEILHVPICRSTCINWPMIRRHFLVSIDCYVGLRNLHNWFSLIHLHPKSAYSHAAFPSASDCRSFAISVINIVVTLPSFPMSSTSLLSCDFGQLQPLLTPFQVTLQDQPLHPPESTWQSHIHFIA